MDSQKTLYLIDGSNYIYRAYYALPRLTNSKGFPTNAIYGFINMLKKLIQERNPDYLAVTLDHKAPTFRKELFKDYKATRKPTPDTLKKQIPVIKEIIKNYNIPIFEMPGYEADDLLAYIAAKASNAEFKTYIVSSDKDLLQVVTDNINIYNPQKGFVLDKTAVEELYSISPIYFPDFLALTGDPVDNIPGVPGIGEKTAKELILKFGTIEETLKNTEELPLKTKAALEENSEQLILSKQLAQVNIDLDLKLTWQKLKIISPNYPKLIEIFEELGFSAQTKELIKNINSTIEVIPALIQDSQNLLKLIEKIKKEKMFSFYPQIQDNILKGLIVSANEQLYLIDKTIIDENKGDLEELFQNPKIEKISHGIKEISKLLEYSGLRIKSPSFDIQVIAYLLNPSLGDYSLFKIALNYLARAEEIASLLLKSDKEADSDKKSMLNCYVINKSYPTLKEQIKKINLDELYYGIEEPLIFILKNMESKGIKVNKLSLNKLSKEYNAKIDGLSKKIYSTAGEKFNLNSPKQIREILYQKLSLKPIKKGKTGPSTDEETLKSLHQEHPLPGLILQYRELNKIKSTYIEGLLKCISKEDGHIHPTFNQTITQTGRLSCRNPNLQNIPIRSELGKQIRSVFIPSKDNYIFISADYSQIELRILAHLSKDTQLIKSFEHNLDIHTHTAATIFGVNEKIVSNEMRRIAKTVNFGIVYGISPYGLSKQLNISIDEASQFIESYFKLYPGVKRYIEKEIIVGRERGYTSTLFNRIRYIPEINSTESSIREFGERLAINTPIQGTAADLIKKAMIETNREIETANLNAQLLLQIHDELLFEVDSKKINLLKKLIKDTMESSIILEIPIIANMRTGFNWLELTEKIPGGKPND
ncbi:MAG: DNA polymerase I [Candidatus Saelkia tenebricola]|nr:DNA polymerase I [Candidatus Saelkia tenebricola]